MNGGPCDRGQEVEDGEAKNAHPHHAGDAGYHGLDAWNEPSDDDALATMMIKVSLSGCPKSTITRKGPHLGEAFLVNTTGPIGKRIPDTGSENCRDENWPE